MSEENPTPPPAQPGTPVAEPQPSVLAILALVFGIISIPGACVWCLGLPFAIAAIVMGHMARSKAQHDPQSEGGAGLALGGLICGYIGAALCVLTVVAIVVLQLLGEDVASKFEEINRKLEEAQRDNPSSSIVERVLTPNYSIR